MKVAYVIASPDAAIAGAGGASTHAREVIEGLRRNGHVVLPAFGGDMLAVRKDVGDTGVRPALARQLTPSSPLRQTARDVRNALVDLRIAREMIRAFREFRPDVIYERRMVARFGGYIAARLLGIPYLLEVNEPADFVYPNDRSFVRLPKWGLERIRHNGAIALTAVSHNCADSLPDLAKTRTVVMPNAVDSARFVAGATERAAVRRRLGISPQAKVIGFCGYIAPYHGLPALLDAFEMLQDSEDLCLLVIGDGPQREQLEEKAKTLRNRVIFTGLVNYESVPGHLSALDIGVLPASNSFGSPIKLFEYAAIGLPIVAPRVGPVVDVFNDGDGWLVTNDSPSEIARAIREILQNGDIARARADRFRSKVVENFTWDRVASRISTMILASADASSCP